MKMETRKVSMNMSDSITSYRAIQSLLNFDHYLLCPICSPKYLCEPDSNVRVLSLLPTILTEGTVRYTSTLVAIPSWHLSLASSNTSTQSRPRPTTFRLPYGWQFLTTTIFLTPSRGISTGQRGSIRAHSRHVSECIQNGYTASLHDGIVIARPWWLCRSIGYVCPLSLKYLTDVFIYAGLILVIFHVLHYLSSCSLVFSWYLDILIFQSGHISNLATYIWVSFSSEPNTLHSDFLTLWRARVPTNQRAHNKSINKTAVWV